MHKFEMPQWAVDRVMERRGKLHIYDDMRPEKTALVVVDLQNGFMLPEYSPRPVGTSIGTVPNVNRLAETLRSTGGKIIWIKNTVNDQSLSEWSHWYNMGRPEWSRERAESFREGAAGHELYKDLVVKPEDEIFHKHRFSAFLPESSDLALRLRKGGYDTVLIVGTVTNVCCESSARDAMMMNFRTVMVSDGNSAFSDHEHEATLAAFYRIFGDVMDTAMACELLQKNHVRFNVAAE
jgi:ureidoacrylate peracid hydrolase